MSKIKNKSVGMTREQIEQKQAKSELIRIAGFYVENREQLEASLYYKRPGIALYIFSESCYDDALIFPCHSRRSYAASCDFHRRYCHDST